MITRRRQGIASRAIAPLALVLSLGGLWAAPHADAAGSTMTMRATAYGPSATDNYPYGATDYFGRPLVPGDIAVDPSVIPLNTCLAVTGYTSPTLPQGGFVGDAVDEGGGVVGLHVDLYMPAGPAAVSAFGMQTVSVTVLGPSNPQESGTAACSAYQTKGAGTGSAAPAHAMRAVGTAPTWVGSPGRFLVVRP